MNKTEIITKKIDLHPCYDGAKSFYKKAYLKIASLKEIDQNGYIVRDAMISIDLYSYDTKVLTIFKDIQKHKKDAYILYTPIDDCYYNDEYYTRTTMRHVRECLKQYYFNDTITSLLECTNYKRQQIIDCAMCFKTWIKID